MATTSTTTTTNSTHPLGNLCHLSYDIRRSIWQKLLRVDVPATVFSAYEPPSQPLAPDTYAHRLSILRVSQRIRSEVMPLLYEGRTIKVTAGRTSTAPASNWPKIELAHPHMPSLTVFAPCEGQSGCAVTRGPDKPQCCCGPYAYLNVARIPRIHVDLVGFADSRALETVLVHVNKLFGRPFIIAAHTPAAWQAFSIHLTCTLVGHRTTAANAALPGCAEAGVIISEIDFPPGRCHADVSWLIGNAVYYFLRTKFFGPATWWCFSRCALVRVPYEEFCAWWERALAAGYLPTVNVESRIPLSPPEMGRDTVSFAVRFRRREARGLPQLPRWFLPARRQVRYAA